MFRSILIFLLFIVVFSCSNNGKVNNQPSSSFFSMIDFMEDEKKWMVNDKISLIKILSLNGETDTIYVEQPDFELELDVFINADINKPALSDKYSVDSIFRSEKLYKITYTAKDEKLKTRKLSVRFDDQNKVVNIDIRLFNGSPITKNVQHLIYRPNYGYVIKNEQYFMGDKDVIKVEGFFKQKRR
ncbi:MAG: hypothetical protein ACK5ZX_03385 [Bacteroidota bacterium]